VWTKLQPIKSPKLQRQRFERPHDPRGADYLAKDTGVPTLVGTNVEHGIPRADQPTIIAFQHVFIIRNDSVPVTESHKKFRMYHRVVHKYSCIRRQIAQPAKEFNFGPFFARQQLVERAITLGAS